jgi:hypothetical protein
MNAERVSAKAVLAMRRITSFIANMISVGGCASAGFAEAGALVPPTSVGGAPLRSIRDFNIIRFPLTSGFSIDFILGAASLHRHGFKKRLKHLWINVKITVCNLKYISIE